MGCGVGVLQVSPEWFDYTEPYLTASSQEEQGVVGSVFRKQGLLRPSLPEQLIKQAEWALSAQ